MFLFPLTYFHESMHSFLHISEFGMKASSFSITVIERGFSFLAYFFFLLRCFMFKREVCSVKDVWVDIRRQTKAMSSTGNPPSPFQMGWKPGGWRRSWGERKRPALLASLGGSSLACAQGAPWAADMQCLTMIPCHPLPMSSPAPPEAVFSSWSYNAFAVTDFCLLWD